MLILSFIIALFLGLVLGLIPGLHPNTIISVLSSLNLPAPDMAIFIVVLLASHTLVAYIPSIFFGIPEQSSVVSALAGQQLVRQGLGLRVLKTVLFSSAMAALLSVALFPLALSVLPPLYSVLQPYIGWILLLLSGVLLWRSRKPFLSLSIFLLAGMLGLYTLHSPMPDPFLPLFSGMFAIASMSVYSRGALPLQHEDPMDASALRFSVVGVAGGFLADLLPGISSASQVAVLLALFLPMDSMAYMASVASISTSAAILSFATAASIGKARLGATAFLMQALPVGENLPLILIAFLAATALAAAFLYLLRQPLSRLAYLDFGHFNRLLAAYLVAVVVLLDGPVGLAILLLGAALGYLCIRLDVERRNLMGAVIVPTLLLLFRVFV